MRTGRLALAPVAWADLADLQALKADPRVYGLMLGGVRSPIQAAFDLAADAALWPAQGFGLWSVRDAATAAFLGVAGLAERPDGRGIGMRFAVWPEAQGRGIAREAAAAALRFGHEAAGLPRIVAVARATNFASRTVLGGIGMVPRDTFVQGGHAMLLYDSRR